jgi:anti-sigma factor RsiW
MDSMVEHDEIFTLMMEALDGDLQADDRQELQAHLHTCPACAREWQALQTIHRLLLQAPFLMPAAGFAQRTLAHLPNRRYRLLTLGVIYGILLFSGLAPLALAGWLLLQIGPALNQPAFVRSLLQVGNEIWRLVIVAAGAFWQGLGSLGNLVGQRPAVIGWLLLMVGFVVLWGGIYGQLTSPQRRNV